MKEISFYKTRLNNRYAISISTGNQKDGYKIHDALVITKKQALELAKKINDSFKN